MPHPGHDGHGSALFLVDATETIRRLRGMDRIRAGGEMTVQVVAVPMPGTRPAPRTLAMASLQLDLADSIAAAARPFGVEPQR